LLLIFLAAIAFGFWEVYRSFYVGTGKNDGEVMGQTLGAISGAVAKGNALNGLGVLLFSPGKGAFFSLLSCYCTVWFEAAPVISQMAGRFSSCGNRDLDDWYRTRSLCRG
jgi:hypothetical protein